MNVEVLTAGSLPPDLVGVGVPVSTHEDGPRPAVPTDGFGDAVRASAELDPAWCKRHGFSGKVGQTVVLSTGPAPQPDIVLVGVGDPSKLVGDQGLESLRRASAAFVRAVSAGPGAAFLLPELAGGSVEATAAAVAEGAVLASYRYDEFRTGDLPGQLDRLVIAVGPGVDPAPVTAGVGRGARIAQSVAMARDLVNEPPSSLTPEKFADFFVRPA